MKRFWKVAGVLDRALYLDGRPVRTPAGRPLALPTDALAAAVEQEWRVQGDVVDPRSMPLTGLANAAIDRIGNDPAAFAADIAIYAETDLLCYRAVEPLELVEAEAAAWDPLLMWARMRYDVTFEVVQGVVHRAQPAATVARLAEAVAARGPFALAGLSPLVSMAGSLVVGLAIAEGAINAANGFETAHLDELWQARRWGEDALATQARAARRSDFFAAAPFLALLG